MLNDKLKILALISDSISLHCNIYIVSFYIHRYVQKYIAYRKISNLSPGLIDIFKHLLGDLYWRELIFGGHFVLVAAFQDFKI